MNKLIHPKKTKFDSFYNKRFFKKNERWRTWENPCKKCKERFRALVNEIDCYVDKVENFGDPQWFKDNDDLGYVECWSQGNWRRMKKLSYK